MAELFMGFILPALITGGVQQDALMKQQRAVCEQVKQLKANYDNYYNSAVDYLKDQARASAQMTKETNAFKQQINRTKAQLDTIKKDAELTQLITDLILSLLLVVIAIVFYIKYRGLFSTEELDIPDL